MLKMKTLSVGNLGTCCYILWDDAADTCVVIDPGAEADRIRCACEGRKIEAILLTHGHFDHVGAVRKIAEQAKCPVYLCPEEKKLPVFMTAGPLYSTDGYGDSVCVAGLQFEVLPTPGHTPGSVCLLVDDVIFSGDTLFAGGCGRTDIGGDWVAIQKSLKRLGEIEGYFKVLPGHGESTTLAYEKRYNPYMR